MFDVWFLSPAIAPKQKIIKKSFRISWHLWSISYIVWFRGFPLLPHSVLIGILSRLLTWKTFQIFRKWSLYFVFSVSCYHRLENRCVTFPIWKFSLGLFWAVGAMYATFEGSFLCFLGQKIILKFFWKYPSVCTEKLQTIKQRKIIKNRLHVEFQNSM